MDIDPRALHMAYIQFSLLHIPATVIVGDSLAMRFREDWHTMAHVMGSWSARLGTAGKSAGEGAIALSPAMPPRAAAIAANSSAPKQEPSATAIERNGQLRLF
ncbi:hypothetical protein ACU8NU_26195 (plasmid) [Rhizobium leguminosarum]